MKVFVLGAGKVGRALAKRLAAAGDDVVLRPARKGVPTTPIDADVIVLAVRDRQLGPVAADLATSGVVPRRAVVVHNAGALPAEALEAVRPVCAGIAQMHPMISFASRTFFPSLARGHVHVEGDVAAAKKARTLAKHLGMTARTFPSLDTVGYHAAAGLVANGAAALAAVGADLLAVAGVPRGFAPKMLGPLLRSVAENVEALGFPEALTGPIRRGDPSSIEKQVAILRERLPEALPLFLAASWAQLPLARAIGDAPAEGFDAIAAVLEAAGRARASRTGRRAAARRPARTAPPSSGRSRVARSRSGR